MMHSSLLRSDETLFRDPEVFELTYLPDHLHHRDAQTRELAFLLQSALRGASAGSAVLRGPPGTGKTTTVRHLFAAVTEETKRVVPVYVNCRHDHTPLAVYRSIFAQVCGCPAPSAGRYLGEIKQGIAARLHGENAALIVCLDDADELIPAGTYNPLLYQLLRLYEKWDVRKAGVFAVTSDLALNLYAEADPSVRSVFHPTEVNFLPYMKAEIHGILTDRVRQGLYPGVVPKAVLDQIAGIAAAEQDIRVGIDLLRGAVRRAEKDGRRRVGPEDVTAASRAIIAPSLLNRAAELSAGERAFACWIAERSRDGADMASGAVFEAVQEYLPVGKTTYHERLNALAKTGIIDLVPGSGRGRDVRLRFDAADVFAACNVRTKPAKTRTEPEIP